MPWRRSCSRHLTIVLVVGCHQIVGVNTLPVISKTLGSDDLDARSDLEFTFQADASGKGPVTGPDIREIMVIIMVQWSIRAMDGGSCGKTE